MLFLKYILKTFSIHRRASGTAKHKMEKNLFKKFWIFHKEKWNALSSHKYKSLYHFLWLLQKSKKRMRAGFGGLKRNVGRANLQKQERNTIKSVQVCLARPPTANKRCRRISRNCWAFLHLELCYCNFQHMRKSLNNFHFFVQLQSKRCATSLPTM